MARELRRVVLLRRVGLFARRESAIARDSESSRIQNRHADRQLLLQDAEMSSFPWAPSCPDLESTCPPGRNHQRGGQIPESPRGGERWEKPRSALQRCGKTQRRTGGDHRRRSEPEQEGESQDRGLSPHARKVVTSADSPSLGHARAAAPVPCFRSADDLTRTCILLKLVVSTPLMRPYRNQSPRHIRGKSPRPVVIDEPARKAIQTVGQVRRRGRAPPFAFMRAWLVLSCLACVSPVHGFMSQPLTKLIHRFAKRDDAR